jgi:DNA-binding NarL/FixJ family response regulator
LEVTKLIGRGLENPDIAELRGSAIRTVSTHVTNIYKKLGIDEPTGRKKRQALARMAREAGLGD